MKNKERERERKENRMIEDTHSHKMKNNYYNINYTGFGIERIDTNKAEKNKVSSRTAKY